MLAGVDCPFCGGKMRAGRVEIGGAFPSMWTALSWKPSDRRSGSRRLFGFFRGRDASLCDVCEAVVMDPKATPAET